MENLDIYLIQGIKHGIEKEAAARTAKEVVLDAVHNPNIQTAAMESFIPPQSLDGSKKSILSSTKDFLTNKDVQKAGKEAVTTR